MVGVTEEMPAESAGAGPVSARDLRVSDQEREHVAELLQRAVGRGLISLDEFTTRTDRALAAGTRGELNAVLIDLPGLTSTETPTPRRERPPVPEADRRELTNALSALRRTGNWVVPGELVVRNRMGSVELDFTDARVEHDVVRVELDDIMGSTKLLVPQDATVETDELELTASTLKNHARAGSGHPRFVLTGLVRFGSVTVAHPRYLRVGRLMVRFPWQVSVTRRR